MRDVPGRTRRPNAADRRSIAVSAGRADSKQGSVNRSPDPAPQLPCRQGPFRDRRDASPRVPGSPGRRRVPWVRTPVRGRPLHDWHQGGDRHGFTTGGVKACRAARPARPARHRRPRTAPPPSCRRCESRRTDRPGTGRRAMPLQTRPGKGRNTEATQRFFRRSSGQLKPPRIRRWDLNGRCADPVPR